MRVSFLFFSENCRLSRKKTERGVHYDRPLRIADEDCFVEVVDLSFFNDEGLSNFEEGKGLTADFLLGFLCEDN